MVGAKEFAIGRKVIEAKKVNPLIANIKMPHFMKNHEDEIKSVKGTFLDNIFQNKFALPKVNEDEEKSIEIIKRFPKMAKPHDTRSINPILDEHNSQSSREDKKYNSKDNSDFKIPSFLDLFKEGEEEEREEEGDEIPDELINRITYKVFQNIRNYLDSDFSKSAGNKHIKLEISL